MEKRKPFSTLISFRSRFCGLILTKERVRQIMIIKGTIMLNDDNNAFPFIERMKSNRHKNTVAKGELIPNNSWLIVPMPTALRLKFQRKRKT